MKSRLLVITGPAILEKTRIAVETALLMDGEIVNAEPALFYRGMDIGTDKPSTDDRKSVPFHLIDIINPGGQIWPSDYAQQGTSAIEEIFARGRVPIIVGGSAAHIRLLTGAATPPLVPPHMERLAKAAEDEADSNTANPRDDPRELLGAFASLSEELVSLNAAFKEAGLSGPEESNGKERYDAVKVGLFISDPALTLYVKASVDSMVEAGLLEEVKSLLSAGYHSRLRPMKAVGYFQMHAFLAGKCEWSDAVSSFKRHAVRRAKRSLEDLQREPGITWIDISDRKEKDSAAEIARIFRSA